jgi:hypothetical protein
MPKMRDYYFKYEEVGTTSPQVPTKWKATGRIPPRGNIMLSEHDHRDEVVRF